MAKRVFAVLVLIIVLIITLNYKSVLKKFFPVQYNKEVEKYSTKYNMDPHLVYSIILAESKFNPDAKSSKGAVGLMQITPQTGRYIASLLKMDDYSDEKLCEPGTNIKLGTFYLSKLFKDFNGDINCVLAAYNGGEGNVRKWIQESMGKSLVVEGIPFKETKNYISKVKRYYKIYNFLYETKDTAGDNQK